MDAKNGAESKAAQEREKNERELFAAKERRLHEARKAAAEKRENDLVGPFILAASLPCCSCAESSFSSPRSGIFETITTEGNSGYTDNYHTLTPPHLQVFSDLDKKGAFPDPYAVEIERTFIPWSAYNHRHRSRNVLICWLFRLLNRVELNLAQVQHVRETVDGLLISAIRKVHNEKEEVAPSCCRRHGTVFICSSLCEQAAKKRQREKDEEEKRVEEQRKLDEELARRRRVFFHDRAFLRVFCHLIGIFLAESAAFHTHKYC